MLSLALIGCGLVSPAVRLPTGADPRPTPRVVERPWSPPLLRCSGRAAPSSRSPGVRSRSRPARDHETQIYDRSLSEGESLSGLHRKPHPDQPERSQSELRRDACRELGLRLCVGCGRVTSSPTSTWWRARMPCESPSPMGSCCRPRSIGSDADSDVAVIKVDPSLVALVPVEQGDIDEVRGGPACRSPSAIRLAWWARMTTGIVSAVGRSVEAADAIQHPPGHPDRCRHQPRQLRRPLAQREGAR